MSVAPQESEGEEDKSEQEWELVKETICGLQHFRNAASPLYVCSYLSENGNVDRSDVIRTRTNTQEYSC